MKVDLSPFKKACACGREHGIQVRGIYIEEGALDKIPAFFLSGELKEYKTPTLLCDDNTYHAAGERLHALLPQSACIILPSENLHANEIAVDKTLKQLHENTDILLAVGSGTIHDTARYAAFQRGIPFISVPTAASVDGFVSTVAAMTWYGFKKTLPAQAPLYVFADSTIFSKAPYRLTAAGVSDLLGKYTAIADWRIAHLVTGEYICDAICRMEMEALEKVASCVEDVADGKIEAYEELMYALILSGLAMQMAGNSRPASGAEHHMSHLWEMEAINPHTDALHGEKVSVGLVQCIKAYQQAKERIQTGRCSVAKYAGLDIERIKNHFQSESLCKDILEENTPDPLAEVDREALRGKLPAIAEILETLPSVEQIEELISKAGGVKTMAEIGLSEDILALSMELSPFVRNRLTFMRLMKLLKF